VFFTSHAFQDEVDFIESKWLGFDFGVFGTKGLVYFSGNGYSRSGTETAVLLVKIGESVNVGFGLKFLDFIFGSFQDRFYVLPDELVIVVWVEFDDSQQVQQLGKF
jgi:hypothetical protein